MLRDIVVTEAGVGYSVVTEGDTDKTVVLLSAVKTSLVVWLVSFWFTWDVVITAGDPVEVSVVGFEVSADPMVE